MATPKEIRKAIETGKPVLVRFPVFNEECMLTIVSIDERGRVFYTADGNAFDRISAEILPSKEQ